MSDDLAKRGAGDGRPADNRRAAGRYPAAVRRVWLAWREAAEFRTIPARLVDVSIGGCRLVTASPTPIDRTILVRLDGPLLPVWFEAKALENLPDESGHLAVRVAFPGACPYEFFMAAIYGVASVDAARRQPHLPAYLAESRRKD
jgi:hypothetical protein